MEKKHHFLNPGHFKLDGGAMFGIIPKPLWETKARPDDLNRINLALRLWLIETENRLVLTDTGIGDYHGHKFDEQFDVRGPASPLVIALEKYGKKPSDLTDLVISHLHFDHVGGILYKEDNQFKPVFENATLHLHKKHYEYSLNPTERDAGSFHSKYFKPIVEYFIEKDQVHFLEDEHGELISDIGLNYKCSFGHTPWLMHPYDEKYIYLADLIPTSAHVHIPWVMGYDISPGETTAYKRKFLDFCIEQDLTIIFEHDPKYSSCQVEKNEKGKYVPINMMA